MELQVSGRRRTMTTRKSLMVALFAILIVVASAYGQANVYKNDVQMDITTTNPFVILGGPCWEGVTFTNGFVKNNFKTIVLPDGGIQVTWTTIIQVDNGIGAVSGTSYNIKENFSYTYPLNKGQYVLPQRIFFRLTQNQTGKVFAVSQSSVIMYDPDTNTTKVMVDKYEVSCP